MTLTDRDRKIMIGLVPLALIAGIWLLVLAPKRSEASKVQERLTSAEQRRDTAEAKAGTVESAKTDYAKDYETVVRLGKAIPSSVDMPSLIVQLSKASKGAHISFEKVATGDRTSSPATGGGGQTVTTPKTKLFTYEIDATITTPNGKKRYRHLQRLAFLPSQSNALLIFLGVTSDGKNALVIGNGSDPLHPVGGGGAHCRPSHAKCSAVWFQTGDSYTFVDSKDRKYVVKVHGIKAIEVSDMGKGKKPSAEGSGAAAGVSAVGASQVPAAAPPLVDLITGN